jgi:N-acetylmuramoyl-L-alanine amidase
MSKKVALMCGHGKSADGSWDPGANYGKYSEAALMLPITEAAVKYLRGCGVTVISDTDSANNKNMIVDVAWANKEKCDVYVSVHCDYSKAPTGVMPLYVSSAGKKFARALNSAISKGMPMKSRGAVKRRDLYELNQTDMPAVILETGSIKADLEIFRTEYDKYGKLIAKGICKYLGIEFKEPAAAPVKKPVVAAVAKPVTSTKKKSNNTKLRSKAKELAWPKGTPVKKYRWKGGDATKAFKDALNRVFSKKTRSKWGKAARKGCSCDVFVATCVRDTGLDKHYPRGLREQYSYKAKHFKRLVYKNIRPIDKIKKGDIVIYAKNKSKSKGHTGIQGKKDFYQANHEHYYGHRTSAKSALKKLKPKRPYVVILRPKG